jgi:hypothetical protein
MTTANVRAAATDTGFIAAAFLWRNVIVLTALALFVMTALARP